MPKVQKTFLIDEDLAKVIDKVIECTGSNFTKVATAALLQFLFRGYGEPEEGANSPTPDVSWFRIVILLERGDLKVGDLPAVILDDFISAKQRWIESVEDVNPNPEASPTLARHLDEARRQLAQAKRMRKNLKNAIDRTENPMDAIIEHLSFHMKP